MYAVPALNGTSAGSQETVAVYSSVGVAAVAGVPPVAGAAIPPSAAIETVLSVFGNTAVMIPELIGFSAVLAPDTVKKFAGTPVSVWVPSAARVIVAV